MSEENENHLNFNYESSPTLNDNKSKYIHFPYSCKENNINNNQNYIISKTKQILTKNKENYYRENIPSQTTPLKIMNNSSGEIIPNPSIYSRPYNQDEYEENQFNEFLKDLMLAEGQLEKMKIQLVQCKDFNIEDCFRIFERDQKNDKLYPEDIKTGLQLLGVFISDFEVKLFFNRFDLLKKGYLNFSNIFDIFIPFTSQYRSMSEKKEPNSCCNCRCPDVFCNDTISLLKNLLDTIIKYENKFNFMRRGFTTLNLKLKKIFGKIDLGKNGFFSNDDLTIYMNKNRIFTDKKELDLLFIRLDKNRNGKIDFKEIYDETHPIYF